MYRRREKPSPPGGPPGRAFRAGAGRGGAARAMMNAGDGHDFFPQLPHEEEDQWLQALAAADAAAGAQAGPSDRVGDLEQARRAAGRSCAACRRRVGVDSVQPSDARSSRVAGAFSPREAAAGL